MNAFATAQSFAHAANDHIEAVQSLADILFGASERLFALNIETARTLFASTAQDAGATDLQALYLSRMGRSTDAYEQMAAYVRNLSALSVQTQSELTAFGTERSAEFSRAFCEYCDKIAQGAPQGSDAFTEAFTTVLNQTAAAYESFLKTTRDVAATNFAAAGTALQTIKPEATVAPKAARKSA